MALQPGILPDVVRAHQPGHSPVRARMHLQGRLGRQPHGSAPLHTDALLEAVATEHAGGGRGENQMKALALTKTPSHSERRLRISFLQYNSFAPTDKQQLEPAQPAYPPSRPTI